MESQDDGADAVRRRIQVLTKDELKDLLKGTRFSWFWDQ